MGVTAPTNFYLAPPLTTHLSDDNRASYDKPPRSRGQPAGRRCVFYLFWPILVAPSLPVLSMSLENRGDSLCANEN